MSRCPDCGMKECCGSYMSEDIELKQAEIDELVDMLVEGKELVDLHTQKDGVLMALINWSKKVNKRLKHR